MEAALYFEIASRAESREFSRYGKAQPRQYDETLLDDAHSMRLAQKRHQARADARLPREAITFPYTGGSHKDLFFVR